MKRLLVRLFWSFSVVKGYGGKWRIAVKPPFYDPFGLCETFLTRKRAEARAQELRNNGGFFFNYYPGKD